MKKDTYLWVCIFLLAIALVLVFPYVKGGFRATMRVILYILGNPVFWITLAAPTILQSQYAFVIKNLMRTIKNYSTSDQNSSINKQELEENLELLDNNISLAWNDFNNQIMSIIFAMLFVFLDFGKTLSSNLSLLSRRTDKYEELYELVINDFDLSILLLGAIGLLLFLIIYILTGKLITLAKFKQYIENEKSRESKKPFPPMNVVTFTRIFIICYAYMLMSYKIWGEVFYVWI